MASTKVGPCADTTGRAIERAHLAVTLPDGQTAGVHLGPALAPVVQHILIVAEPGTELRGRVFRTDGMPLRSFVAVNVTIADETYRLRSDGLSPNRTSAEGFTATVEQDVERDRGRRWWDLLTND